MNSSGRYKTTVRRHTHLKNRFIAGIFRIRNGVATM
jgi:hypothetical protein